MRIQWKALSAVLFVGAALAQTPEDELNARIARIRYPMLARMNSIQGDVHLKLVSGVVAVLPKPSLISQVAVENANLVGSLPGMLDLDILFHFILDDHFTKVPTQVTVKRGNAFERIFLRLFGLKTQKMVTEYLCYQAPPSPPNRQEFSGATLEIWIYSSVQCAIPD